MCAPAGRRGCVRSCSTAAGASCAPTAARAPRSRMPRCPRFRKQSPGSRRTAASAAFLAVVVGPPFGGSMSFAQDYLAESVKVIEKLDRDQIEKMASLLADGRARAGRLFILGVGGSAGNASHAVNDFRKVCGIEAYAPTANVSEVTAPTNDDAWATVFDTAAYLTGAVGDVSGGTVAGRVAGREGGAPLTNVIRALALEASGYLVTVTELTAWEHSLKNELILGRRMHREHRTPGERLRQLLAATGVQPRSWASSRLICPARDCRSGPCRTPGLIRLFDTIARSSRTRTIRWQRSRSWCSQDRPCSIWVPPPAHWVAICATTSAASSMAWRSTLGPPPPRDHTIARSLTSTSTRRRSRITSQLGATTPSSAPMCSSTFAIRAQCSTSSRRCSQTAAVS